MTVDILMATYNGGRYLRNQLLSLQQQTHGDWRLLIRDDGSSDDTLHIIDEFERIDPRIQRVGRDNPANLGAARSFMALTAWSDADYLMFCDQDDIWFEKKLELLLNFARNNFDPQLPSLVYCDAYGYSDSQGVITLPRVSLLQANTLQEFMFFNGGYQGCSILFNQALNRMLKDYRASYFLHDDIASLLAHVFGRVYFLPQRLMLYRQHDANVTGNISGRFWQRLQRIVSTRGFVINRVHFDEKKAFFDAYQNELDDHALRLFEAYFSYVDKNLAGRLGVVLRHGFSMGGHRWALLLKTLLRRPIGGP